MAFSSSVCAIFFLISFGRESEGQGMLVQGRWRQFEICPGSLPVTRRGRGRPSVAAEKYASISVPLRLKCQHVHQCHKSMCAVVTCTFDDSCMSPFLPRGCLSVMDPRLPTRWTLIRISALANIFTELQDSCRCPLHYWQLWLQAIIVIISCRPLWPAHVNLISQECPEHNVWLFGLVQVMIWMFVCCLFLFFVFLEM